MALVPMPIGSKQPKEVVNYRVGYKCGNCVHFLHPQSCRLVSGTIAMEAVCDLWEGQENSRPYSKEFFMAEHEKVSKHGE